LVQPGTLMLKLDSDLISPRTLERLEQNPQTQQVIYFFQKARYGLRPGNESIDRLERTRRRLLIAG
jgi:hypothetical protein